MTCHKTTDFWTNLKGSMSTFFSAKRSSTWREDVRFYHPIDKGRENILFTFLTHSNTHIDTKTSFSVSGTTTKIIIIMIKIVLMKKCGKADIGLRRGCLLLKRKADSMVQFLCRAVWPDLAKLWKSWAAYRGFIS